MPPSHSLTKTPKFTRGEKCLYVHLVVTFSIIIIMSLIYFVHLCIVKHTRNDVLKIYKRTHDKSLSGLSASDYQSIGVTYLNITPLTIVCNTLLLRERWSLAPAQCTSMRDDPDMSNYLFLWIIKYQIDGKHTHTDVKRTLTHSHFSRDDYQNNIGLFEHVQPILKKEYYVGFNINSYEISSQLVQPLSPESVIIRKSSSNIAPVNTIVTDDTLKKYAKAMVLIDWDVNISQKGDTSDSVANPVRPIFSDKCSIYANPIVDLRDYEFCVTFVQNGPIADHGAMFVMNSKIIGFFSWGDIEGKGVPLIILNIIHFREWFESIVLF